MNNISTSFNGYEYNDYGVCVNPDKSYEFGKWDSYYFEISISETPKGWVYGYDWNCKTSGGGGGCSLVGRNFYLSKSEAIVACAEYIKKCFSRDKGATKAIAELDRIIQIESTPKPTAKQYTIFDYL